jgi:alpha,alpha-trehalose phosphorylase
MSTYRYPVDPWRLVETEYDPSDLGLTETLFGLGNGYLGMRATPEEGRDAHSHGTFVNGFHETWKIKHAEDAFGFAKVGQTIVNVPDPKVIKLYVDDEPLLLANADLDHYERTIDMRSGLLTRELIWRTPGGKRVKVSSTRMVSLVDRHLAVMTFEVTLLDSTAPVVISSQLLNRQDGEDEYHVPSAALGEGFDPRVSNGFDHRVLEPRLQRNGDNIVLGYRAAHSKMTLACGMRHELATTSPASCETSVSDDLAKAVFSVRGEPGVPITLTKYVAFHTSTGVPTPELADRCERTLNRAAGEGVGTALAAQAAWLDNHWATADITIEHDPAAQQALRWNLFQLVQATARTHEQGVAAKGVSAGGYEGHYFWDTEVYVLPYLAYVDQEAARKLLRFRWRMLDDARRRARTLSQKGALYPWRTINGEEASAYYAAGTAQYHINAAVIFALHRYLDASGDLAFRADEGAEILVETARLWEDLGFHGNDRRFHIHSVTGPDEYTTVVNDNFYTNVMARFHLSYAADTMRDLKANDPEAYESVQRRTNLTDDELDAWDKAWRAMYLPFDEARGIHPQDSTFLELEPWPWDSVSDDQYPLLLNFHPLVIYRHQVLKQADVVLAMYLRRGHFSTEQKRRNFDFYDSMTTGDSSLSACVQAIVAADIGHEDVALDYFTKALYLDLCNTHGNTSDGVHIASCGGVWAGMVHGFGGVIEHGTHLELRPRVPAAWGKISFHLQRQGAVISVTADANGATVTVVEGASTKLTVEGSVSTLAAGESIVIAPAAD